MPISINSAVSLLKTGKVIAYPTEAVFGLGCDPDCEQAVLQILSLKKRAIEKGLILIASSYQQLLPYIDETLLTTVQKQQAFNSWPGPYSWIMPKNKQTPYYLTGKFDSIAVRVTDHPIAKQLCMNFGKPLVSTSANLAGLSPCINRDQVKAQFGQYFPVTIGEIGQQHNPSQIRDIKSGRLIRQG